MEWICLVDRSNKLYVDYSYYTVPCHVEWNAMEAKNNNNHFVSTECNCSFLSQQTQKLLDEDIASPNSPASGLHHLQRAH